MSNILDAIDIGPIGTVELDNGQKLEVPKLTNLKLIKIAKFLGIDGMKLYEQYREIVYNDSLSEQEKWITIISELKEEQLIHILSILLDIDDQAALNIDPVVTLEIIEIYVDKTNVAKAFTIVRSLAKKLTGKEIPDIMSRFQKPVTDEVTAEATETAG